MVKERRLRWLGHAASHLENNMVEQLPFATRIPGHVQPVGRPCGTWMHYAMRDVKDGSANGLPQPRMELAERSHEQTYWAGIVDGAKLF